MLEELGRKIKVLEISYEVRGFVDGRYVLRIRNQRTGKERYEVWGEKKWEECCNKSNTYGVGSERNIQIYERHISGETLSNLSREYGISPTRVGKICQKQRKNKI